METFKILEIDWIVLLAPDGFFAWTKPSVSFTIVTGEVTL
jgi:hypothetical protein